MDQMQTCDICKEKSNTVEIRQSEDMRCDKCKTLQKNQEIEKLQVTEKITKLQSYEQSL